MRVVYARVSRADFAKSLGEMREWLDRHNRPLVRFETEAEAGTITVKGSAVVRGKKVVREARPASIVWGVQPQANIPTVTGGIAAT